MKHLFLSLILISTLTTNAQFGIVGNVNASYLGGGDATYKGIKHAGINAGFGVFQKIHLNPALDLQWKLNYLILSNKNPVENDRTYKPKYISLPITLAFKCGDFNLQAGGFVNQMISAKNYSWYLGDNFSWAVKNWSYVHRTNFGGIAGIGYDMKTCLIEFHYMFDLRQIRKDEWDNGRLVGCKNRAFIVGLYLPFKTFN